MSANHEYIKLLIQDSFGDKKIAILDYGCGSGDLLNFLEHKNIQKYIGVDVNHNSIKIAKKNFENKVFHFKTINTNQSLEPLQKNSFDLIVLIGVLQYMNENEIKMLLKLSKKILKKDGILLLSCATDHYIYKLMNLYSLFIPNNYINRKKIVKKLLKNNFKLMILEERGLFIAPFFSHIITLFFDIFDQIVFKNKGTIGFTGKIIRKIFKPLLILEQKLPLDFGFTLYIKCKKIA